MANLPQGYVRVDVPEQDPVLAMRVAAHAPEKSTLLMHWLKSAGIWALSTAAGFAFPLAAVYHVHRDLTTSEHTVLWLAIIAVAGLITAIFTKR